MRQDISQAILEVKSAKDLRQISHLKKMTGHKTAFRIKIGNYRIGITIENNNVTFVDFAYRKDIYKKFP